MRTPKLFLQGPDLYSESHCNMQIVWDDPLGSRYIPSSSVHGPGISLEMRHLRDFELRNLRAKLDLTDQTCKTLSFYRLENGGSENPSGFSSITTGW